VTVGTTHSSEVVCPLLDHVVVLLDEPAYADVVACGFLGERFGRVKPKKVTSSIAGTYSAYGIAGTSTLLELFDGRLPDARLAGGLVLSFDRPGSVGPAQLRLEQTGGVTSEHELVYRNLPDSEERQPWYHMVRADLGPDSPLLLFFNEVTVDYYASVGAARGPDGELARRGYLDAAFGPVEPGDRMLEDIREVRLLVRPERGERIAAALGALGYTTDRPGGGRWRLTGPAAEIVLDPAPDGPEGVVEIVAALDRPPAQPREFTFGQTTRLALQSDGTARWSFTPPSI
jgi:Family of unknown function (DUF5829)